MELRPGQNLDNGRYEVVKPVKGGFCSSVYVIKNKNVDLYNLLKLNLPHDDLNKNEIPDAVYEFTKKNHIERTFHELEMLRRFNHPNIAQVIDTITLEDNIGLVFNFRGKNSLKRDIDSVDDLDSFVGPLNVHYKYFSKVGAVSKFARGILGAICKINLEDVLHRDIHPGNIIFDDQFEPIIIDFGFSTKVKDYDGMWGSRTYAPPEIYLNQANRDSDFWHVGLILYEVLAKKHLIDNSSDPRDKRLKVIEKVKKLNNPRNAVVFYEELIEKFTDLRQKYLKEIESYDEVGALKEFRDYVSTKMSHSEMLRIMRSTNTGIYSKKKSDNEIMDDSMYSDDLYFDFMKKTFDINFENEDRNLKGRILGLLDILLETAAYFCQPQHLLPGDFAYPTKRREAWKLKSYLEYEWIGRSQCEPFEIIKRKMNILKNMIRR